MFSQSDLDQFAQRGTALTTVQTQIENFLQGFPFAEILKPATVADGIIRLEPDAVDGYIAKFEEQAQSKELLKFTPASGAASRMFKALFGLLHDLENSNTALSEITKDEKRKSFFQRISDFAFYPALVEAIGGQAAMDKALEEKEYTTILNGLLIETGLNYGKMPKGLLHFHSYADGVRTPVEEHMVEGANYAKGSGNKVSLHFTVSPEHVAGFQDQVETARDDFEKSYDVSFEVSYSVQKPATDTIAVDLDNQPFRLDSGEILFRPGGHGALIENLDELDADIIFIKNIDNVVPDEIKEETFRYKKALAGLLLSFQEKIFAYIQQIDNQLGEALLDEIETFIEKELCVGLGESYASLSNDDKAAQLRSILNRPLRVCGMVKNEGEPGGGPFWTQNSDGTVSLQVVESVQIDSEDPDKQAIVQQATHFNPVDLVCMPRDMHGKKFDLLQFRDPQTGFISQKSKDGRSLRAQELPGLWNGAMAFWNTLFVEVPIITFNPVKTVFDLLRKEHQGEKLVIND